MFDAFRQRHVRQNVFARVIVGKNLVCENLVCMYVGDRKFVVGGIG
jgi:hypothetical protein